MTLRGVALLLALAGALPAWGDRDDDLVYGRLRHVEPGVAVQRPDEAGADEALVNGPLLPGDRLFSDSSGRAEVQFSEGSLLRLDRRSKLDFEDPESARDQDLVVLTLWSGSVYLRVAEGRRHADFLIETPDGSVDVREGGSYRVDVDRRDTRLLVFEGQARLESGRRGVTVLAGERSYARRGEAPQRSDDFSPAEIDDDFARWDEARGSLSWRADNRYLPDELETYGADLEGYGTWHHEVEVGYVWRPHVTVGWRPYSQGRWVWTAYGWTWVPYEPWGWAPFHYGRWGHSTALGWYWIPGRTWGPAWVSWRAGGDYVGWCALGHGDRPVRGPSHRGHAVPRSPRGSLVADQADTAGWQFARRGDLTSRDLARRRVELAPAEAQQTRTLDLSRLRLDRQTQVVDASRAVPRTGRVKPSPGDYVPELSSDPLTTIPAPTLRRRLPDDRGYDTRQGGDATSRARERAPSDERDTRRQPAVEDRSQRYERSRTRERAGSADDERRAAPDAATRRRSDERRRDDDGRQSAEPRRSQPAEREVLRRFFEPLAERRSPSSRGSDRDNDSARRPRDSGAERRAPERSAPRAEPPRERRSPPPAQDRAVQRQPVKDRDQ